VREIESIERGEGEPLKYAILGTTIIVRFSNDFLHGADRSLAGAYKSPGSAI